MHIYLKYSQTWKNRFQYIPIGGNKTNCRSALDLDTGQVRCAFQRLSCLPYGCHDLCMVHKDSCTTRQSNHQTSSQVSSPPPHCPPPLSPLPCPASSSESQSSITCTGMLEGLGIALYGPVHGRACPCCTAQYGAEPQYAPPGWTAAARSVR